MSNSRKNIKWKIRIGIAIAIFAAVFAKPIYGILTSQEHWSKNELTDYKKLFKEDEWKNLLIFNTVDSKTRQPESQYIYKDDFNVFVTKVLIPDSLNLMRAVLIKNETLGKKNNEFYFAIRSFDSKISIKAAKLPLVMDIQLNSDSSNFKIVDTTQNHISYYLMFKTFYLTFNKNQNYIKAESNGAYIFTAITFLKKIIFVYHISDPSKSYKH